MKMQHPEITITDRGTMDFETFVENVQESTFDPIEQAKKDLEGKKAGRNPTPRLPTERHGSLIRVKGDDNPWRDVTQQVDLLKHKQMQAVAPNTENKAAARRLKQLQKTVREQSAPRDVPLPKVQA